MILTDDYNVIRENILWDIYGIDGENELKSIKIKDLELSYIENILLSEIEFRKQDLN